MIANPVAAMTSYSGIHNDFETPIDVNQNGVLFLNSSIRYEQIRDGSSNTLFVIETRLNEGGDLGWMSGTRSSLRNTVIKTSSSKSTETNPESESESEVAYDYHAGMKSMGRGPARTGSVNLNPEFVGGGSSYHTGGLHVLLGDGSVRFLSQNIAQKVLRNLAHRSDGEMIDENF